MWLMYHWLCGSRKAPTPTPPPHRYPCSTITRYLHPFSTNMQVHMHEGKRRTEVAERERGWGGEGCWGGGVQVYDNTQTDALVENSLNCKRGVLPKIQESKYQLIRGSRWKKGRCEMRFMLSCFCVSASCIFTPPHTPPSPCTILYPRWR